MNAFPDWGFFVDVRVFAGGREAVGQWSGGMGMQRERH